jgi:hypothetical protein
MLTCGRCRGREEYLIKSYDVHEESVYTVVWGYL